MRKWIKFVPVILLAAFCLKVVTASAQLSQGYQCQGNVIASSTTPANMLSSGFKAFGIQPRAAATVAVWCWFYTGAVPTAVPSACATPSGVVGSGCFEATTTKPWSGGCNGQGCAHSQQGIACALSTGSSSEIIDACGSY